MTYIGPTPSQKLATPTSQYFSGNGSATAFTLNRPVNVAEDLNVFVNNVTQQPGAGKSYTATGTTLTFDAAPDAGTNNVYVVYRGLSEGTLRLEQDPNSGITATTGTFSSSVAATTGTFSSSVNVGTIKDAGNNATAMTIDSNGVVKTPQVPCFFITGNNNAYVTASPVVFGSTQIDTRSGVDLSNNKYVVPVAGKWHFHLQFGIVRVTGGGSIYPLIQRTPSGGSAQSFGYSYYSPINSSGVMSYDGLDVDCIVDCAVNDSINAVVSQSSGHYYNGANECRFFGYFLG